MYIAKSISPNHCVKSTFHLRSLIIVQAFGVLFTRNTERLQDGTLNSLKNKMALLSRYERYLIDLSRYVLISTVLLSETIKVNE